MPCPGWVAWLVAALSCTPTGWGFDSQSSRYLRCGFDAKLVCIWEATNQCFSLMLMFLSLFLSLILPLSLKSINIFLKIKKTCAGKDVEKRDPLCTVGGNADWCSHCGKQYRVTSKKLKMELLLMTQRFYF